MKKTTKLAVSAFSGLASVCSDPHVGKGWTSLYRRRTASSSPIKFQPPVPPPRGLWFQGMFLRAGSTCPPPAFGEHAHYQSTIPQSGQLNSEQRG